MKTYALLSLLFTSAMAAYAQGTVDFANLHSGLPNAPVYMADGVTKLSGQQFMAELLAGPSANNLAVIATTGFLTGNGAGYFSGGTQVVNSVLPGDTAWVRVDVWNTMSGASFVQAKASGLANSWWQSGVFSVQTGSPLVNPTPPGPLAGLGNSPVYLNSVPEPSALALFSCSLALAAFRKGLNNSMKTKRRYLSPLQVPVTLGGKLYAQPLLPAAFAYRVR